MNEEIIQTIEELKIIVEKIVTYGIGDFGEQYITLRKKLICEKKIKSKLPDWLKTSRNLDDLKNHFYKKNISFSSIRTLLLNDFSQIIYELEFPDDLEEYKDLQEKNKNSYEKKYFQLYILLRDNREFFKWDELEEDIIDIAVKPFINISEIIIDGHIIKVDEVFKIEIKSTKDAIKKSIEKKISDNKKAQKLYLDNLFQTTNSEKMPEIITQTTEFNNIFSENLFDILLKKQKLEIQKDFQKDNNKLKNIQNENNKIFIVHGHDIEMRETVARFVEKIELEAVILYEQTNGGKTIIEKIEENTDVRYGIILYSPCDQGKSQKEEKLKNRPRQNVVLEHGYLMAKLGRKNVIALTKGELELPSDLSGIINPNYDSAGFWKFKIAKELKENGLKIDMNKIE
ncbi:nucleotide-binding protein [Cetobacterium sp.]|uniref:nucleotide-binding protein n=1 Tax=Cetobacterium sp. TaxID=2071632 RepID=UPI002FC80CBB